jgi:hypothetical protein
MRACCSCDQKPFPTAANNGLLRRTPGNAFHAKRKISKISQLQIMGGVEVLIHALVLTLLAWTRLVAKFSLNT